MIIAALILVMYAWGHLGSGGGLTEVVSRPVAIMAGATILVSLALYFWTPEKLKPFTLGMFLLLGATVAWLVVETGGFDSPFVAVWMITAVFAGMFGPSGTGAVLLAVSGYAAVQFLRGDFSVSDVPTFLLTGILPLIVSLIVWKNTDSESEKRTNITKPQTTELSKVTNRAEVIINAIGDGVLAIDGQGVVQLINPAAQLIIGWDQHDAVKLSYKSVLQLTAADGQDIRPGADPIAQAINTNQEHRVSSLGLLTNSGKKLIISITVSPIGEPGSGVIVTFRDVTKEKAEEREQAEFISTASHEMRTPVASIEGYLGLVLNPATASIDERARVYVAKAHESVQHLGRLFQDLLDITKAEDGRLATNPKVTDIVEFVRGVADGFKQKATEKGLQLIYQPDMIEKKSKERQLNPVFHAHVDNDHLREVIGNLIENAIKYTPRGSVTIDIKGDDDAVEISVTDSGIGIPSEDIPHLFQKFYRVDNTDTREIGGTGLGLYLCRRLVESMNGRIWVESVYQRGSTFFVSLPRLTRDEASQLLEQEPKPAPAPPPAAEPARPQVNAPPAAAASVYPQPQAPVQPHAVQAPPRVAETPGVRRSAISQVPVNVPLAAIESAPHQYAYYNRTPAPARPQPPAQEPGQPGR